VSYFDSLGILIIKLLHIRCRLVLVHLLTGGGLWFALFDRRLAGTTGHSFFYLNFGVVLRLLEDLLGLVFL
jgi:hypothetical protein